jgi:hypothetical protein
LRDPEYKFEWVPAIIGLGFLPLAAWTCYCGYWLHKFRPDLFHLFTYRPGALSIHLDAAVFLFLGGLIVTIFLAFGFMLLALGIFGDFPPVRGRRYRLPRELQGVVFPYRVLHLPADFADADASESKNVTSTKPAKEAP